MSVALKWLVFDIGGMLCREVMDLFAQVMTAEIRSQQRSAGKLIREDDITQSFLALWRAKYAISSEQDWVEGERSFWAELAERLRRGLGIEIDAAYWLGRTPELIVPIPGMRELLGELSTAGVPMAICSNNCSFWARRQRELLGVDQIIDPYFQVYSYEVGSEQSDVGEKLFRSLLQRTTLLPGAHLFVDERNSNIVAARRCGMQSLRLNATDDRRAILLRTSLIELGMLR